jgi:SNF2 family DNA or RNA helicase
MERIFSSFSQQTFLLQQAISMKWPGVFVQNIDGSVAPAKRQAIIDDFYASESGVLILNPQAAGIGLNITAANHVFHFIPEWNPALTEQSTKRSHRRGQLLPVMVHYMFYSGTIEEVISRRANEKLQISEELLGPALENDEVLSQFEALEISPLKSQLQT